MDTEIVGNVVFEPLAVDTETAAKLLGLSASTVRAHMRKGDLIARYSGTKPVFPLAELKAFIAHLPERPKPL